MSSNARRGALFAIVAALLLANPLYVGPLVNDPEQRTRIATGYTATAVDPTNASGQRTIITSLGDDEILEIEEFASVNEYSYYGDRYRAPTEASALLRRATENGTVRTGNGTVAFTLARIAADYRFLAISGGESVRYFRFDVVTGDGAVVTATPVNQSSVAWYIVYSDTRLYTSLPDYQRETIEKVIDANEYGYRPYNDGFVHLTDELVLKNDTYYVFSPAIHVDDFDVGAMVEAVLKLVLSLFGGLSLLAAVAFTTLSYRERDEHET